MRAPLLIRSGRFLLLKRSAGRGRIHRARALSTGVAAALLALGLFAAPGDAEILSQNGGGIQCNAAPELYTTGPDIVINDQGSSYRDWYIQRVYYWDGSAFQPGGWGHWHNRYRYEVNWTDSITHLEHGYDVFSAYSGYYAVVTWVWDGQRGRFIEAKWGLAHGRFFGEDGGWWCYEEPEDRTFG